MNFYSILDLLTWLSPLVLLGGAIVCFYRLNTLDRIHKILLSYLLFELGIDLLSRIIGYYSVSNLIVIPFMSLAELLFFSAVYMHWIGRKIVPAVFATQLVFSVFFFWETYEILTKPPAEIQAYTSVLNAFCIVVLSMLSFVNNMRNYMHINWQQFSFNAVVLFYFSVKLTFSIPLNFLVNEGSFHTLLFWLAHLLVTLFFYLFLIRMIWKNGRIRM